MGTIIFLVSVIVLGVVTYYTFREKPATKKVDDIDRLKGYKGIMQRNRDSREGGFYQHPPMYGPPYGNNKKIPPPPPPPVYKAPVSRTGWSSSRDPRELDNSDIADDLLLNPISPVSIWHSNDDSHGSSWSNDSGSSYDSGSSDSSGGDCGGD